MRGANGHGVGDAEEKEGRKMKRPSGFIGFNDTMLDDGSIRV